MCYRHLPASAFPLQHILGMNLCDFLYTASFCSSSVVFFTISIILISGSKGQKVVRACTIRLLNLGPAKHEKVAIYAVNQRISNV